MGGEDAIQKSRRETDFTICSIYKVTLCVLVSVHVIVEIHWTYFYLFIYLLEYQCHICWWWPTMDHILSQVRLGIRYLLSTWWTESCCCYKCTRGKKYRIAPFTSKLCVKGYFEIVDEARPLSGFPPTHADIFTKIMKLNKLPNFKVIRALIASKSTFEK